MFIKKYLNLIIVSILALAFFIATASFSYYSQTNDYVKWSSPDETANYFFTKEFSLTGQLSFFDKANLIGDNSVIPRSMRSDNGWVKPVSFLGIILIYGKLATILGTQIIPFLTPFFAAWGIIFFYLIVKRLFSDRVALWSAFLLATFPVYIYYTVRSMFHNVLFIVLLLIGVYIFSLGLGNKSEKIKTKFLSLSLPKRRCWEFIATLSSGLFFGLAVITRTSELIWLAPAMIIIYFFYARRLGFSKLFLFLAGFLFALVPVAYYNQIIYNSFWHGGYNEMNRSLNNIIVSGSDIWRSTWSGQFNYYHEYLNKIFKSIFYFGFSFKQSLIMFGHYVYEMFLVLFWGGSLGLVFLLGQNFRRFKKKYLVYVLVWLLISSILVFYYGSWKFNDNPDLTQFTIGNSYTRYWLPLYLGLLPLVALAVVRLSRSLIVNLKIRLSFKKIIIAGLQFLVIFTISLCSIFFVLYGSSEGLVYLYNNNKTEEINTKTVWSLTEPDAVIITQYYDKFFWPERRIIMGVISNEQILKETSKLINYYPVYYYNFYLNSADLNYLNNHKLATYNLQISEIKKLNVKFGLYKLSSNATTTPSNNYEQNIKK